MLIISQQRVRFTDPLVITCPYDAHTFLMFPTARSGEQKEAYIDAGLAREYLEMQPNPAEALPASCMLSGASDSPRRLLALLSCDRRRVEEAVARGGAV